MRYLEQLAKDTTARVLPRRGPAWLPTMTVTGTSETAPPAAKAAVSSSPVREVLHAPWEDRNGAEGHWTRPSEGAELRPRGGWVSQRRAFSLDAVFPADARVEVRTSVVADPAVQTTRERARDEDAGRPLPLAAAPWVAPRRDEAVADRSPEGGLNLLEIFAELGRRQEAMDARSRTEMQTQEPAYVERAQRAEGASVRKVVQELEEVHLTIGSIVVQLESPPVVQQPTPPRAFPPRAERGAASRRMARSFLDR